MGAFLGSVVLNVSNSTRAAEFWTKALGYVPSTHNPEFLVPPGVNPPFSEAGPAHLHLDRSDKMHLDLWLDRSGGTMQQEVDRLVGLGAQRVQNWQYGPNADHVVLADTEGNLFCLCP